MANIPAASLHAFVQALGQGNQHLYCLAPGTRRWEHHTILTTAEGASLTRHMACTIGGDYADCFMVDAPGGSASIYVTNGTSAEGIRNGLVEGLGHIINGYYTITVSGAA